MFPASYWTYFGAGFLAFVSGLAVFGYWEHYYHFQYARAIPVTIFSTLWLAVLFISVAHIWQGASRSVIGAGTFIVCLSATLSGFWLFVFYPGVMSPDAIWQWRQALKDRYVAWHPPFHAMLMHVTQSWSRDPSLFSFVQGLLFWGCLFYLIRQVAGSDRRFLVHSGIMMLVPPLWLYSNATVSNAWTAAFMMLSAAFLIKAMARDDRRVLIASVLALSVAVMFRRESGLVVLAPISAHVWRFGKRGRFLRTVRDVLLIGALVWLPSAVVANSSRMMKNGANPAGRGLLNQYVGTVVHARSHMTEAEFESERQSIDGEFGTGAFRGLIGRYTCYSGNYVVWKSLGIEPAVERKPEIRNSFVIGRIASVAVRHPLDLLEHQRCYVAHLSQFAGLYYQNWGMIVRNQRLDTLRTGMGIPVDSRLPSIKNWYRRFMKALLNHPVLSLVARHYVFLEGAAIVLVVGVWRRRVELIVPPLFSFAYVLAFVIADPSPAWRYLLPSYVCAWVGLLAVVSDVVAGKIWPGRWLARGGSS